MEHDEDQKVETPEAAIKRIDKKMTRIMWIDSIGYLLLGLGFYGKVVAKKNSEAFHPLLNDAQIVQAMIIAGGLIAIWGIARTLLLVQQKKRIVASQRNN